MDGECVSCATGGGYQVLKTAAVQLQSPARTFIQIYTLQH